MEVGGVSRVDGMSGVKGVRRVSDTASSYDFLEFQTWIRVDVIELFLDFWNGHYAADQVYFYEPNSKKSANLHKHAAHL